MFEWAATILSQGPTTGAIDVVAVRGVTGVLSCSPFHVKLNKAGKKGDSCRIVKLSVNTKDVALRMKLGGAGEAFFVERTHEKVFEGSEKVFQDNTAQPAANPSSASASKDPTFLSSPQPPTAPILPSGVDAGQQGIAEVRRRQRSFSDGDIDGDYRYLLEEQNIMAISLGIPVSFNHDSLKDEKQMDKKQVDPPTTSSADLLTEIETNHIGIEGNRMETGTKNDTENDVSSSLGPLGPPDPGITADNHCSVQTSSDPEAVLTEADYGGGSLLKSESPKSSTSTTSLKGGDEGTKDKEIRSARRIRSLSDVSISEQRSVGFRERESSQGSKGNSPMHENRPSNDTSSTTGSRAITELTEGTSTAPITPSHPSSDVSTAPPSWSWTWGALPVKSMSRSTPDLTQLATDSKTSAGTSANAGAQIVSSLTEQSSSAGYNASLQHDVEVSVQQLVATESPLMNPVPSSSGSHIEDALKNDETGSKYSKEDSKDSKEDSKDSVGVDLFDDDSIEGEGDCASIPLFVGGDNHDNQDQDIVQDSGIKDPSSLIEVGLTGQYAVSQHNDMDGGGEKGVGYKWRDSFTDFGQTPFRLYRGNNQKKGAVVGGSEPNLLKEYMRGENEKVEVQVNSTELINHNQHDQVKEEGDDLRYDVKGNDNDNAYDGVQDNSLATAEMTKITNPDDIIDDVIDSNEKPTPPLDEKIESEGGGGGGKMIRLADGDGDTDQELDTLSLHEIPLDEISPEPAGGDFYDSDTESYLSLSLEDGEGGKQTRGYRKYRYRRVLVPSQDQLQSLDLNDGENELSFELQNQENKVGYASVTPPLRTQLFVWPQDAKIVIIDIEGAITSVSKGGKGWGIGGFLSVPRTAVHNGVAKLLTNIHKNGYRILYIAQSTSTALGTKEHLAKLSAGSDIKLPPGPVFQSPDSLIRAFGPARTDLFKAAALRGLKSLFPNGHNPYYACFGTRPCDMIAFSRCGVPEGRIFLVSPDTGEISGVNRTFRSSYEQVNAVLHEMFPAVSDYQSRSPRSPQYPPFSPYGSHLSPFSTVTSPVTFNLPPSTGRSNIGGLKALTSSKSQGESSCSLAEDDYSDFNFWKIPHVAI